jgi:hypothetical protein
VARLLLQVVSRSASLRAADRDTLCASLEATLEPPNQALRGLAHNYPVAVQCSGEEPTSKRIQTKPCGVDDSRTRHLLLNCHPEISHIVMLSVAKDLLRW